MLWIVTGPFSFRLGIFTIGAAAETGMIVSGRVVDENNGAVPLAAVHFQSAGKAPIEAGQTSTGPGGDFTIRLPAAGSSW